MSKNETYLLIEFGAETCLRIKKLLFKNDAWSMKIAKQVAQKFSLLKTRAKIFHPDLNNLELNKMLCSYSDEDIRDALAIEVIK